jgi:aspartyl-tRNA(Asn)/glutamyl-tRNA(Gln) amidotransferase subunit A
MSARQIAAEVTQHRSSAREQCEAAIARIAAKNPALNAIVTLRPEASLAEADAVDARVAAGEKLPLAGVPYTLKDNLWAKGWRATQGSKLFADHVAPRDSACVERFRAAGAVLMGITNCSEFACKGVTTNQLFGPTRNPWDTRLTPGGSSGGAAAATAAGMTPLALCTDAGGSARRPAAHTGLIGMKPTLGLVPNPYGFPEPNLGISVIGVLATDATDAALALDVLAGYDPLDPYSAPAPAARPAKPRSELRIAWSRDLGCGFPIDADVLAILESLVHRLEGAGCGIEESSPRWPPGTAEYPLLAIQQSGLAALHGDALRTRRQDFDPDIAAQVEAGLGHSGADVAGRMLMREQIAQALAQFFGDYDLLLTPAAPVTAWPAGPRGHAAFTPLFNYCGAPACSVPAGLVRGLPVGLQVAGPRWSDSCILDFARFVETLVPALEAP